MKVGVFGAGSWGAALSMVLLRNKHQVYLWSNDPAEEEKIRKTRRLVRKLPEVSIPQEIEVTCDHNIFMEDAELLVVAVPSKLLRSFAGSMRGQFSGKPKIVVSATKGLEASSLYTMTEVLESLWCETNTTSIIKGVVALSGPSHAEEVARGLPTAVVSAHANENLARNVQETFLTSRFRVYTNEDRKGVEVGAALKNIIAIAVGISDGLGFGDNARAALISRGLYELSLAGKEMGTRAETFSGLSALGDLVATCTSRHSRNRKFGELVAKGYQAEDAEDEIGMVVEGVTTVKVIPDLQKKFSLELPISEEVYKIVFEGEDPKGAVERLMLRELKPEINLPHT